MGQAPSDLPDPLDNQTAAAAPAGGGADDLLSQLAGDEIDRLLAEADVESGAAKTEGAAATAPAAPAAEVVAEPAVVEAPVVAQEAAVPAVEAVAADAPAEAAAATQGKPAASDLDAQLEKLAQELLPQTEQERALTPVDATPAAEEAAIVAQAGEERGALLAGAPAAGEAESLLGEEEAGPVPWYLKPLLWVNAPFASLSDQARDLIGKVALATLLFSFTVLAFVAMTRHRL